MRPTASCFLLLVVAASHALQLRPPVAGACVPRERDALLAFKEGITADPAGRLASWRRGEDCCRWRGVRCSNWTGHVRKLQLRNVCAEYGPDEKTALVGQLTPSLLSLDHLEHLDLSGNSLEGPTRHVPEFLGSLKSLRYLNLSFIPFTSMLPPQLGNLSKLHYLDLSGTCSIFIERTLSTDLSWLTNLSSLRYLNLNGVNLSIADDWPHVVNMIPSLRVLRFSACCLKRANQSLPHLNLTKLEKLDLSFNYFDHPSASCWFWNLTSLKYLNLAWTSLYGQFSNALGDMTSLQVFDFSYNDAASIIAPNLLRNLCNLEILNLERSLSSGNMTELFESLSHCPSKKLRELHLEGNNITGMLPTEMGQFTNLVTLDLSWNKLIGPVLRNLCNLEILNLESNLWFGNITELFESFLHCPSKKLRELYLADNNITGTLPTGMGQFTSLVTLELLHNKLTGFVPSEITMLTNLTTMYLNSNDLHGVITEEHFAGLQSLKYIDLSDNHLNIVVGSEWLPPFRLKYADFASCQMGPQFPAWLQWSVDIEEIDISSNAITDQLPDWFSKAFSKATYLDISHNRISGGLPPNMETMSVRYLFVDSNQITGQIPPLPINLTDLFISKKNALSGHVPESICKSQELEILDLADNLLEGQFPQCSGIKDLASLFLSNNRFSGKFPSFLQSCSNLEFLDLSKNNFSGRLPMWIGDFVRLRCLQLSYNAFYGNIPSSITNLRNLSRLILAGNRLSGVIPLHLSNLTTMAGKNDLQYTYVGFDLSAVMKRQERYYGDYMLTIDLSSNHLTGGIPEDIASLALINLNLSINLFSGKIPDKIGSMQSLESLDLSRNKLFGEIPLGLSNLTYLSYLDLSYNNLSGKIPSGPQLDSLYANNPFMYSGNNGLCGPPLQTNCSRGIASKQGDSDRNRTTTHVPELMFYFHLGLGSGFVVGLWVIFCTMLFKKTWRIAYFCFFDKVYDKIYIFVVVTWASLAQKNTLR